MSTHSGRLELRVTRPLRPVTNADVQSCATWSKAWETACKMSGLLDKSLAVETEIDPASLSKIQSGQNGIKPDQLFSLMDACGTELPLMWLNYQRGYDIEAMRQRETELQRQLREANERAEAAESKLATITEFVKQARAA